MSHETTQPFLPALRMLVGFVVRTAPGRAALLGLLAVAEGLLGPLVMAASGLVVARAPAAYAAGPSSTAAYELGVAIALVGAAFVGGQLLAPVRDAVATSIGSRVAQRLRDRFLAATLRPPGLAHLEDRETADEIQRAGEYEWEGLSPLTRIVRELGLSLRTLVTGAGAAVLLGGLVWWAPLLVLAAMAATHVWMAGDERRAVEQHEAYAAVDRRADYFRDLSLDPPAAKEVRLFGLVDLLAVETRRYRTEFLSYVWRARRAQLGPVLGVVASIAVAIGATVWALAAGASGAGGDSGAGGAADLTVGVQAIFALSALAHPMLESWWVRQGAVALPHLLALEDRTVPGEVRATGTVRAEELPQESVRFAGVRFGYPGMDRPVLDGLDLEIPAGGSLALVGSNGAGKTTLLKLLARLYDPDEGAVLVDGHDLRELDLGSWRERLAVIFADFVRYELSARDNVAMARPYAGHRAAAVARAAERAGVDFIDELPGGWDTVLSRQYAGGVDLSGGQWQRLALARALRAADDGARLLVLDEPTSALDVRAEAALFDRFLELTAGTTTLLVTHRLSSVRHVDRVAVLDGGRVAELGTHAELIAENGVYARMFRLQADRFRGRGTPEGGTHA